MLYGYVTLDQISELFKYSFFIFGYYHFMMLFFDRREHPLFLFLFWFFAVTSVFWLLFFVPTLLIEFGVLS